jgi:hypothetical protein
MSTVYLDRRLAWLRSIFCADYGRAFGETNEVSETQEFKRSGWLEVFCRAAGKGVALILA